MADLQSLNGASLEFNKPLSYGELAIRMRREERERIAKFIESREYAADGEGRGSKELADLVRALE